MVADAAGGLEPDPAQDQAGASFPLVSPLSTRESRVFSVCLCVSALHGGERGTQLLAPASGAASGGTGETRKGPQKSQGGGIPVPVLCELTLTSSGVCSGGSTS